MFYNQATNANSEPPFFLFRTRFQYNFKITIIVSKLKKSIMDGFGLSTHMRLKLDSLPPPNNLDYPKDLIRLDHAENELIRPELVGLYKDAVASSMNEDVKLIAPRRDFFANSTVRSSLILQDSAVIPCF